jgi:GTP-binding protein EngB required for normal cell division
LIVNNLFQFDKVYRQMIVSVHGASQVGKSSLIETFLTSKPSNSTLPTFEMCHVYGNHRINESNISNFIECDHLVLVYSVSDPSSFAYLEQFIDAKIACTLVANKIDQLRVISTEQGNALAQALGAEYIEATCKAPTSAKNIFKFLTKPFSKQQSNPVRINSHAELNPFEPFEQSVLQTCLECYDAYNTASWHSLVPNEFELFAMNGFE